MGQRGLAGATSMIVLALAFSGCLTEQYTWSDFTGSSDDTAGTVALPDPKPAETPVETPQVTATSTTTTQAPPPVTATQTQAPRPPASNKCTQYHEDANMDYIRLETKGLTAYNKQGVAANYRLEAPSYISEHGVLVRAPGASSGCLERDFPCSWSGEGRDGSSKLARGVFGFEAPRTTDTSDPEAGNSWDFEYYAYAKDTSGGVWITQATGMVHVYELQNKSNFFPEFCDLQTSGLI